MFSLSEIDYGETMESGRINIEVQYFKGCPNSQKALENVKLSIESLENVTVNYNEILVENIEDARKYKFRGSPTILINGQDVDGVSANDNPALSCRYYPDGVPSPEKIREFVKYLTEQNSGKGYTDNYNNKSV